MMSDPITLYRKLRIYNSLLLFLLRVTPLFEIVYVSFDVDHNAIYWQIVRDNVDIDVSCREPVAYVDSQHSMWDILCCKHYTNILIPIFV